MELEKKEASRQASVVFRKSFYDKMSKIAKEDGRSVASWLRKLAFDEVSRHGGE